MRTDIKIALAVTLAQLGVAVALLLACSLAGCYGHTGPTPTCSQDPSGLGCLPPLTDVHANEPAASGAPAAK